VTVAAAEDHHLLSTLGIGLATKPDTQKRLRGHVMTKNRTGGHTKSIRAFWPVSARAREGQRLVWEPGASLGATVFRFPQTMPDWPER
jgi:hypothetical protein